MKREKIDFDEWNGPDRGTHRWAGRLVLVASSLVMVAIGYAIWEALIG